MRKLWFLVAAVITASAAPAMSASAAIVPTFAAPTSVSVSSVTATGATVTFTLPTADRTATSEHVIVYPASSPSTQAFSANVSSSPVTVTGLTASTSYYAEVSVNATRGNPASPWKVSAQFTTAAATTPPASAPYPSALSGYHTLAQSYSATDIVNGGWAQNANNTKEGQYLCSVGNTTYSSSLDAVVLSTDGKPIAGNGTNCGHIRSTNTVPTSGDVVEARIWLPSLATAQAFGGTSYPAGALLDWATMWTDGANSTNGAESWPADGELDAVEVAYGASYVNAHYGRISSTGGSTGNFTDAPQGTGPAGTVYGTPAAGAANVQPGWNVVDIEFTSTVANIYYNGTRYITVPSSVLTHKPAYLVFNMSGPNANDSAHAQWPSGAATEDVQYVKVFT